MEILVFGQKWFHKKQIYCELSLFQVLFLSSIFLPRSGKFPYLHGVNVLLQTLEASGTAILFQLNLKSFLSLMYPTCFCPSKTCLLNPGFSCFFSLLCEPSVLPFVPVVNKSCSSCKIRIANSQCEFQLMETRWFLSFKKIVCIGNFCSEEILQVGKYLFLSNLPKKYSFPFQLWERQTQITSGFSSSRLAQTQYTRVLCSFEDYSNERFFTQRPKTAKRNT